MNRRIIITGGPGAGKTTLINALKALGYTCQPESGRDVIQQQVAVGGDALPWRSPMRFAEAMQAIDIHRWQQAESSLRPVFFDRGLPDIAGYLTLIGEPIPAALRRAIDLYRYAPEAIILPPRHDIYQQDNERKQTWQEAVQTYEVMCEIYPRFGYRLCELNATSVAARVERVRAHIQR